MPGTVQGSEDIAEKKADQNSVLMDFIKVNMTQTIKQKNKPNIQYVIQFIFLNFYWSIVDLQCCVSFRCTVK